MFWLNQNPTCCYLVITGDFEAKEKPCGPVGSRRHDWRGKEGLFQTTVIGANRTGQGYAGFFQTYPCIPGQVQFLEICRFEAVHGGNIFMYNYNPPIVVKSIRVATHFCRAIILYLS